MRQHRASPSRENEGISSIISTMLILLLMLSMISTIVMWGTPVLEDYKAQNQYASMKTMMFALDNRLDLLSTMGEDAAISTDLVIPSGSLHIQQKNELWTISFNYAAPSIEHKIDFHYTDFQKNNIGEGGKLIIRSDFPEPVNIVIKDMEENMMGHYPQIFINRSLNISMVSSINSPFLITITNSSNIPLSRCYAFPVNGLRCDFTTPGGAYEFYTINGAVVTNYPQYSHPKWLREPGFFHTTDTPSPGETTDIAVTDEVIMLDISNCIATGQTSVGSGFSQVDMVLSDVEGYLEEQVKDVRINISGKYIDCLYDAYTHESAAYVHLDTRGRWGFEMENAGQNIIFRELGSEYWNKGDKGNSIDLVINQRLFEVNIY